MVSAQALQIGAHHVRPLLDRLVAHEEHVRDEMIDERRRAGDDAPFLVLLELVAGLERADIAVELAGLDRRARGLHAADRHDLDAALPPALERG